MKQLYLVMVTTWNVFLFLLFGEAMTALTNDENNSDEERLQVSSIVCHRGGDERNMVYHRTNLACELSEVCWDSHRHNFAYFQPPGTVDQYVVSAQGTFSLRNALKKYSHLVNLNRYKKSYKDTALPLRIVTEPVRKNELKYHNASVHAIYEGYGNSNFGHFVMDDVMPVYSLMKMFGRLTRDIQVMTLSDLTGAIAKHTGQKGSEYMLARKRLTELFAMLSDRQHLDISQEMSFKKERFTCFRHLLAGHGHLGLMHDDGYAVSDFSRYILQQLARQNQTVADAISAKVEQYQILILKKEGRRRILNVDEVAESLSLAFPNAKVVLFNPANVSIEDQIIEAQRTTVLVTPCGGISFLGMFLRSRASAVVAGLWVPTSKRSSNNDYYLWEYFTEVNTIYYDVLLEEITILPPGNEKRKGVDDYRFYGSLTMNVSKIEMLVAAALRTSGYLLDITK